MPSYQIMERRVLVALLAEGVDRNLTHRNDIILPVPVALLAEGVDRNNVLIAVDVDTILSPSSRRAWIEMTSTPVTIRRR